MFDFDEVVSLSFLKDQKNAVILNEGFFYFWQRYRFPQKFYNRFIRKPNPEIRALMEELRKMRLRIGIVSASNPNYREELGKWLIANGFYFESLILKENPKENTIDFKKRIVLANCDRYFDDREDVVQAINDCSEGRCKAILYTGQSFKELRRELFPVFL
ncbi:hypothetical protein A3G50_00070 [Candidatus Jorgensenbacteria bacterium RIFCSPLOWO2_12_FULL_42_11]|uniref:FCP1 homology domain-containing protein n=1 Tax=Candidatus Jorgensenbacteria bacterium RIFCSPLOWO2_12_FULL_42_11 TaxID=1798473 RepID=A0A1F6C458_9BACT|nr:MAG: hypothetical protein A3G50_00070 [Candidatus Jorgensenbacteria bacterium RIFCSPLOWO2_12_FULL_42_11]